MLDAHHGQQLERYNPRPPGPTEDGLGHLYEFVSGWENIFNSEPIWMMEAAKMLNASNPGKDWLALAKRLGYGERDTNRFMEDSSPSLRLLRDWYESNGRTRYSLDVLLSCLRMISRSDVCSAIEYQLEPEGSAPPVFISYQWDSQEAVLKLRRRLEMAGFPCWMDVGLVGGGDNLYSRIYHGISRAKVLISCLTPRFAASPLCAREVTLADVLHKPILPIMLEPTPWPPPGPMAIIMSSLVYIDLCSKIYILLKSIINESSFQCIQPFNGEFFAIEKVLAVTVALERWGIMNLVSETFWTESHVISRVMWIHRALCQGQSCLTYFHQMPYVLLRRD